MRKSTTIKKELEYSKENWKKKCDTVHSRLIRLLGDCCVTCGTKDREKFQCGHIFKREGDETRWDIHKGGNCVVQCKSCNDYHEEDARPLLNWYKQEFGEDMFEQLRRRHFRVKHMKTHELMALYNDLTQEYNEVLALRQQELGL